MAAAEVPRRFPRRLYKLHQVDLSNPFLYARKKDPKDLPTQKILSIVRTHGPIGSRDLWEHAEKEGIKSKTHMRKLLAWLRGKCLVHTKCLHGDASSPFPARQPNSRKAGAPEVLRFQWVAVPPPPERLPLVDPKIPEPRVYKRRVIQKRLKRLKLKLGDAYMRPAKLKKQRLAAGVVYKPYKYGDPEKLKAAKSYFERRSLILDAVAVRTTGPYAAAEAAKAAAAAAKSKREASR